MTKRSILKHERTAPKTDGYLCSTCEADGFSEVFPTLEARQAHFDETGHGARNLMQHTAEKAAIRQVRETFSGAEEVDRAELERMAPEHRNPGTKLHGKQYGPTKVDRKGSTHEASVKQVRYIGRLIKERMGNPEIEPIRKALADSWIERGERKLDSGEKIVAFAVAQKAINDLLKINPVAVQNAIQEPAQQATQSRARWIVNRYAGKCDQCGEKVEPGEGIWEVNDEGQKTVSHNPGECPSSIDVPAGRYAVEHEGTLKFYHVMPRGLFVMASDEEHKITGKAYIEAVTELIKADPRGAMQRYGHEIGRCGRCGRTLTDEDSRRLGIGPICIEKMGF